MNHTDWMEIRKRNACLCSAWLYYRTVMMCIYICTAATRSNMRPSTFMVVRKACKSNDENSQMQGMLRFYGKKGTNSSPLLHLSSLACALFSPRHICTSEMRLYIEFWEIVFSHSLHFWRNDGKKGIHKRFVCSVTYCIIIFMFNRIET